MTFDEAVARVLKRMPQETKDLICGLEQRELILLHHSVGTGIRNRLGLWNNRARLDSLGSWHPDNASHKILIAVRKALLATAFPKDPDRARVAAQAFREQDRRSREVQRTMFWICPACEAPSSSINKTCHRCGRARPAPESDGG